MSEQKLSEMIRLRKTARPSKPRMVNAAVLNEWADKAAALHEQAEKWELEAKRLYGVGQEIEEMRAALEAKLSKMEEALDAFWADRDIWDFDERGIPETWYPLGELAEGFAKALAGERQ